MMKSSLEIIRIDLKIYNLTEKVDFNYVNQQKGFV